MQFYDHFRKPQYYGVKIFNFQRSKWKYLEYLHNFKVLNLIILGYTVYFFLIYTYTHANTENTAASL